MRYSLNTVSASNIATLLWPTVCRPASSHRPVKASALESVQAKTVKKVASADLPQHVNFPATASRSPRRSFVPPSIAAQTDREVPPHRTYNSTPRARELDHAFVVDSPDRPPYEHAVPHVSPLYPEPRTTPAARPLAPEIDKRVPQGRPRQSNARACESDHAIEVDRPHWRSEATCDPLDSTPCPAPGPHSIAPRLGTRVPHDRSDPQMPRAYESDRAVTVDEPVVQQPMATEPCAPLDSAHRPAISSRPVVAASPGIVAQRHSYPTSPRAHQSVQQIIDNIASNAVQHPQAVNDEEFLPFSNISDSDFIDVAPIAPLATIDRGIANQNRARTAIPPIPRDDLPDLRTDRIRDIETTTPDRRGQ